MELLKLPGFYRFVNGRVDVAVPHDPLQAEQKLAALFPGEAAGLKAYFDGILNPGRETEPQAAGDTSAGAFLDSLFRDEELKLVLLGNLGYFHDDPYTLSLAYYRVAQGAYYKGGASYIRGGSQRLSDHLAAFIRRHGGEVWLNRLVTRVVVEEGRATGVEHRPAGSSGEEGRETRARHVIANNALPNLAEMLPEEEGRALKTGLAGQRRGASLLSVYLGFKKTPRELGYEHYSTSVYDGSVRTQRDIAANNKADFGERSYIFVDYSQVDSALAPAGKSCGAICCIDYPEEWEALSREAYRAEKKRVAELFTERLGQLIPGIGRWIDRTEVGTPLTLRRYTLNPGGAVYGFAQLPGRANPEKATLPQNLHIASAWGRTGGGYSGAIYGGYLCALRLLRRG